MTQTGSALLVVIGLIALIAGIATIFLQMTASQSRRFDALSAAIAGEAAADAAVNLELWRLRRDWGDNAMRPAGRTLSCVGGGLVVDLVVEDENARLNVNLAGEEAIGRTFLAAGVAAGQAAVLAGRVADYVDRDALTADHRREADDYAERADATAPKSAPLDLIEELLRVPGVDGATFARVEPYVSVYSTRSDRLLRPDGTAPAATQIPRSVLRISARVFGEKGVVYKRVAVAEFDPAFAGVPSIRLWRRGYDAPGVRRPPAAALKACEAVILGG